MGQLRVPEVKHVCQSLQDWGFDEHLPECGVIFFSMNAAQLSFLYIFNPNVLVPLFDPTQLSSHCLQQEVSDLEFVTKQDLE